jgi:hypothetical protein
MPARRRRPIFVPLGHASLLAKNPSAFRPDVVNPCASFIDSVTLLGYTFAILHICIERRRRAIALASVYSGCGTCVTAAKSPVVMLPMSERDLSSVVAVPPGC